MDSKIEAASAKVLSALADPVRRQLLDLIALNTEATATTIAVALPITRQAVVKHLAVLEDAGLVTSRRDGREVLYAVQADPIALAAKWLLQRANQWDDRLAQLKRLAES